VGHTHTDIDRIISYVVKHCRTQNIKTWEDFETAAKEAFKSKGYDEHILKVVPIIGITDYDKLFESAKHKIHIHGRS
jgi:hypothetical protein